MKNKILKLLKEQQEVNNQLWLAEIRRRLQDEFKIYTSTNTIKVVINELIEDGKVKTKKIGKSLVVELIE